MQKKRIKLIRAFQLITIAAVISLAVILTTLHISTHNKNFNQRAENMRIDHITQQKSLIKREVERVVDLISERRSRREQETKAMVKRRVYEAYAVAQNIYQQNIAKKSKTEIEIMIVEALRDLRFEQGNGYYFMTRLNGVSILSAATPNLEGLNLSEFQDKTGKYIVKDLIRIAKDPGEGFYEYYWTKPAFAGQNHKKISYIKQFEPLGLFLGTGLYVEDVDAEIKADLLSTISSIRFGENGYIFVNRLNGDALVANGNLIVGNKKLWEVFDKNPDKSRSLFDLEHAAALKPDGDYIYYSMSKMTDPNKEFPKASFICGIPELQWLVGAGIYLDSVEADIAALQTKLEQLLRTEIQRTVLATGIVIVCILILFHLVSARLKKDLDSFVKYFSQMEHDDKEIDTDQIYFDGLSQIADSANTMLHDKKMVLEELRLSEEKYRNFFDTAMVGFFRSRLSDGMLLDVNEKVAEVFGCKIEDIVGKMTAKDLFQDLSQRQELLGRLEKEGKVIDFEEDLLFPGGRKFSCSVSVKAYPDQGYMEGIAVDINERRQAEKLLKESEERFRTMAELLPEPIFECNEELIVTYANFRAFELFGFTQEDFASGISVTDLFVAEELPRAMDNIAMRFSGEKKKHSEYRCLKKDGSSFQALILVSTIIKNEKPCGLRGIIVDLTEQKRAEEEILQLRKLESVGVLAGGIAHDFNNLLAGLFGNIEMAKRFLSDEHKSYKYLESAGLSMEQATGLTQQLLTFAKGGNPIKETLSLASVITDTAKFSLRGSNVKLQFDIDPALWLVAADKGQLSQVISNLIINAKQAMPDGGNISVNAKNVEGPAGKKVQITVIDQGIGIAPQHLSKIFDPYFSTKQQGSGLGLASCYSIIQKHNGTIVAQSELNQGTTFTITLPAVENQNEELLAVTTEEAFTEGFTASARILVLDDEELVQQMCGAMLEEMGHQVEYASDGEKAVKKYREANQEEHGYDVVICDLTIPGGMGGKDAAQEIFKLNPQAKIIVSSGYASDPVMAEYTQYGFKGRVAKPYRFAELEKVIRQALSH
ncbi:MAG: cache domain-containing protein [Desulfuromusa sp.]|jgi:PAS domain S-box-containing protein|nr:cache domain-containing protein [Desulfuromusa sp.]